MNSRLLLALSIPVILVGGYWLLSANQSSYTIAYAEAGSQTEEPQPMKSPPSIAAIEPQTAEEIGIWHRFEKHAYGPDMQQVLYLYQPQGEFDKLAILVHGGNYLSGTAIDGSMEALARYFMQRGYAVASIDYRTLTTERWPVPVLDVAKGIEKTATLLKSRNIQDVTYAGYSAGAVTGALLLYSSEFPTVRYIDRFIGLSGLYDKNAIGADPVAAIKQHSLEGLSILNVVEDIDTPKQPVPALLIEGSEDFFADTYAGTQNSHAEKLAARLQKHGVLSSVFWANKPGFNGHEGPVSLVATRNPELMKVLDRFLEQ